MIDSRDYATAYARALEKAARHIEAYPEAYSVTADMLIDANFDLPVYLECGGGDFIQRVEMRRDSMLLDEKGQKKKKR